jgi:hypothetical protein
MTREVDEELLPLLSSAADNEQVFNTLFSRRSAVSYFLATLRTFPSIDERLRSPGLVKAAKHALSNDLLSILSTGPGIRGKAIYGLTSFFFAGVTEGLAQGKEHGGRRQQSNPLAAGLQAFGASQTKDADVEALVAEWVALLGYR